MHAAHTPELLIDGLTAPRRVSLDGQGRVSLPWEAKGLDGLELPDRLAVGYRERRLLEMLIGSELKKLEGSCHGLLHCDISRILDQDVPETPRNSS
jgi:hypothetical protein